MAQIASASGSVANRISISGMAHLRSMTVAEDRSSAKSIVMIRTMSNTLARSMDLNLTHLRTLRAVVSHGSFSRAAEELHLSQPAVSLHIRQLEECAGHRLLERVGKRAFPTKAGEVLLEHAIRALGELEAAHQALERMRGVVAGRIRVGTGATASTYLLPPLLHRLRSRYPDLELVVRTRSSAEIAAAVAADQREVGIVTLPVSARALAVSPLCVDPLVAIVAPGRTPRPRRAMTAPDLARHPLILYERGGT